MELNSVILENALMTLGQLILDQGLHYEIVAIGGGGLLLLGLIVRTTKDLDIVALVEGDNFISAIPLPTHLLQAIREVGVTYNLGEDWINSGPSDLLKHGLPKGFKKRMHTLQYGGLTIHLAERFDQICFKLYASVDHGPQSKHFEDLKLLKPTEKELVEAKNWCKTHDVSERFANDLASALAALGS